MKEICIDVRMAFNSGIGTYIRNIISRLKDGPFKLRLIAHIGLIEKWPVLNQHDLILASAPVYSIEEQVKFPFLVPACDLFWTPHYNIPLGPLRAKKRLVTIHDVYHLACGNFPQRFYAKVVMNRAVKISDHILTISQFSKDEIVKYTRVSPEKISMIHLGVDSSHFSGESKSDIREKYGLPENYFLFVSNLAPHKNIGRLLKAWNILSKDYPEWKLVLVGKRGRHDFSFPNNVMILGEVDSQDLPVLYQLGFAAIHPSLYEGFGLTPLEAMSSGCPVVVSNAASLPEVCGDCAVYVDPNNVQDIAAGMRKIIQDRNLHAELKRKGLERSRTFTWDKTAYKHVEILDKFA